MGPDVLRKAIENKDRSGIMAACAEDVRVYTPTSYEPVTGREAVGGFFTVVLSVLEDFHYVEQADGEGLHVLRFRAHVGDKPVEGVDLVRLDGEGLVQELTVMLRPLPAQLAVEREVRPRMLAAGKSLSEDSIREIAEAVRAYAAVLAR